MLQTGFSLLLLLLFVSTPVSPFSAPETPEIHLLSPRCVTQRRPLPDRRRRYLAKPSSCLPSFSSFPFLYLNHSRRPVLGSRHNEKRPSTAPGPRVFNYNDLRTPHRPTRSLFFLCPRSCCDSPGSPSPHPKLFSTPNPSAKAHYRSLATPCGPFTYDFKIRRSKQQLLLCVNFNKTFH